MKYMGNIMSNIMKYIGNIMSNIMKYIGNVFEKGHTSLIDTTQVQLSQMSCEQELEKEDGFSYGNNK